MQILRLLAARRAAMAITTASPVSECRDDDGPFFDLDFSSCSVRASSSSSGSLSLSDSDDDECTELDFIISLQRCVSAAPLFSGAPQLKFCASDPPARANSLPSQQPRCTRKRGISTLRSLSFGARKPAPLYGRPSLARSSSGRYSCARSSSSSARSLQLYVSSPSHATGENEAAMERTCRRAPSRDVIRRYFSSISRRLRTAASPRAAKPRGLRHLRKCRSASSVPPSSAAPRCDDSAVEKQDGIAGAIAHCKESQHRASTSESDSPLLQSASDPCNCEAA